MLESASRGVGVCSGGGGGVYSGGSGPGGASAPGGASPVGGLVRGGVWSGGIPACTEADPTREQNE